MICLLNTKRFERNMFVWIVVLLIIIVVCFESEINAKVSGDVNRNMVFHSIRMVASVSFYILVACQLYEIMVLSIDKL